MIATLPKPSVATDAAHDTPITLGESTVLMSHRNAPSSTADLVDRFLTAKQKNIGPRTIDWYRQKLTVLAEAFPDLPLSPEQIEAFLGSIDGVTPETLHGYYRAARALTRWSRRRFALPDPIELVDAPRVPRRIMAVLTEAMVARILLVAGNAAPTAGLSHELVVLRSRRAVALELALFGCGARMGEILQLLHDDVGDDWILIRTGKTGARRVPTPPGFRAAIAGLGAGGRVFCTLDGRPLSYTQAYRIHVTICEAAGVPVELRHPHAARHTVATNFLSRTGDLVATQTLLGHTRLETTRIYIHQAEDLLQSRYRGNNLIAAVGGAPAIQLHLGGQRIASPLPSEPEATR